MPIAKNSENRLNLKKDPVETLCFFAFRLGVMTKEISQNKFCSEPCNLSRLWKIHQKYIEFNIFFGSKDLQTCVIPTTKLSVLFLNV